MFNNQIGVLYTAGVRSQESGVRSQNSGVKLANEYWGVDNGF
ncbi:hypothetical protein [Trichormus sp. NMC-1]|nr:hypothetical protein [Trichormus sp. NMC-1]